MKFPMEATLDDQSASMAAWLRQFGTVLVGSVIYSSSILKNASFFPRSCIFRIIVCWLWHFREPMPANTRISSCYPSYVIAPLKHINWDQILGGVEIQRRLKPPKDTELSENRVPH